MEFLTDILIFTLSTTVGIFIGLAVGIYAVYKYEEDNKEPIFDFDDKEEGES